MGNIPQSSIALNVEESMVFMNYNAKNIYLWKFVGPNQSHYVEHRDGYQDSFISNSDW